MVREITSKTEFDTILSQADDKLVVVDFTATWCGPCRAIAPEFARLSEANPDLIFIKVDVDKCRDIAKAQNISAMPTFKFFKHGNRYHTFCGGSVKKLEDAIAKFSSPDAEPNPEPETPPSGGCEIQ
jgi:thioredoxin 1